MHQMSPFATVRCGILLSLLYNWFHRITLVNITVMTVGIHIAAVLNVQVFERILYIWAIRHPASGYVQGINDLVTPFFVVFLSEYLADGSFSLAQPLFLTDATLVKACQQWSSICTVVSPHYICLVHRCRLTLQMSICGMVFVSVSLLVMPAGPAKTAEPIEMPFWILTRVGTRKQCD